MSPAEALLVFTFEVTRAAREVGVPAPAVGLSTPERDAAARAPWNAGAWVGCVTVPGFETVCSGPVWLTRAGAQSDRRGLRCMARHEVMHLVAGPRHDKSFYQRLFERWGSEGSHCEWGVR